MSATIVTARLELRPFTINDTGFIIELVNSPGWLKYIGDRKISTTEHAAAYLQNGPMKSYLENGYGLSMVALKDAPYSPVGMCGLIKRPHLESPDIGVALLPKYERKGYATEIVAATIAHAKATLGLPYIIAITMPANKACIALLEKAGLTCRKTLAASATEPALLLFSNQQ